MWGVDPPTFGVDDVASACALRLRDASLRVRLLEARAQLAQNSATLRAAMKSDNLHALDKSHVPVDCVSDDELRKLYKQRLARDNSVPRKRYYDRIMNAARLGLCCYCRYGQAKTLDHVVPQAHAPTLALDPWNLVPACSQCNHKLGEKWFTDPQLALLHPYSMPDLGRWLHGAVVEYNPISIEFRASPDASLDARLQSRIRSQFNELGLEEMFSVISADDIVVASRTLKRSFPRGSASDVEAHLSELAHDNFGVDPNSRRGVVFEALSNDEWYIDGGYLDDLGLD